MVPPVVQGVATVNTVGFIVSKRSKAVLAVAIVTLTVRVLPVVF
jgi:hypothetical protein